YTVSLETVKKFNTENLIFTVPFVLYGIFRYLYLVYKKELGSSPTEIVLTDVPLILCVFSWFTLSGVIIFMQ
ncbi:MAG TPA: decaprenyl-phosphate phosphoribosyltransferase, partial [Candidatus Wallbacteria bacterium]|nr:decaprenyl-phosphate phosphoribosyltransferase [Candidatus Wallbacteria bacterium]